MTLPARTEVVGTPISHTSYDELLQLLAEPPEGSAARTVAFCNVHSVMTARRDPALRAAFERIDVTTPDGMPLVWALRLLGVRGQQRVYGPDLMEYALPYGVPRGWRHYFYGATEATLERLRERVATALAPGAQVVGSHAPPYRDLTDAEEAADVAAIRASGATHVWVGLGAPKQERFIARVAPQLPGLTLLAVGAAFDMHAGNVRQAPDWLQRLGLEWLFRLVQEPRRLWRRYLVHNPAFVVALVRQLAVRGRP